MKTNSFHLKKFSITQNHAAMKVGTDGVLLGAWTNCENAKTENPANNIYDSTEKEYFVNWFF